MSDPLIESVQMDGLPNEEKAKRAIVHTLNQIRNNPAARDLGFGTQTFALLTEAAAAMHGEPVEKVRRFYARMEEPK